MITLKAANVSVGIDRRSGTVASVRLAPGRIEMAPTAPAALVEVADLRSGRTYQPLTARCSVRGFRTGGPPGRRSVSFSQHYAGAPFRVAQRLSETPEGIRWEARLRLTGGRQENRSLRVSWVLPAPTGWSVWAPQDTTPRPNDGVTPLRWVYGHQSFRPYGTMIPLAATWGRQAALLAFSPPDVQKPCMTFDLHTQDVPNHVRGVQPAFADRPALKLTYHLVGLRPGRELHLAACLAGARPDWRCVLGHYVRSYPELFEPVPATRSVEGMYSITTPTRLAQGELRKLRAAGVTFVEVHGHFPQYSVYVEPEALADPDRTWRCKPHPGKRLSLADNRGWIRRLNRAGIAPFMYWYNCHALPATIRKRWGRSAMVDERGRPLLKWYTEPSVWGPPDSPFGRHMTEQMGLMLEAYPEMAGLFVDNYAVEMIDFGHDDGVTMVHDRTAYDLNRNHQLLGPPCFEKAHAAGKVIMVNKISTIESLRGADMVLAETRGLASVAKHALACVFRPLFPLKMELPPGRCGVERGLQGLLLNGCTPDDDLYHRDRAAMTAYRPLTDALIGKRWVLDFDPLDVPEGLAGQVFRIDRHAPRGGDAVVVLVDPDRSWREGRFARGVEVTVRLPEAPRYGKATWLAVERSARPAATCRMARRGRTIRVRLPGVGAAGVLRLSRP